VYISFLYQCLPRSPIFTQMQSWLYVAYDPSMNVADDKVDLSMMPVPRLNRRRSC
jgi:hypothetical protein